MALAVRGMTSLRDAFGNGGRQTDRARRVPDAASAFATSLSLILAATFSSASFNAERQPLLR
ncbi:hypothetical protein [Candidatus Symbiopectobacterium sp. NZEC135]|uniref:hypothetical protein n=1 Tax=Candidatus Symbiopectobacterium sp. NZEC135 TaxID=2820471 RepID=UPI0022270DC6|nr:hypothetical protein [Candidatus Symbiopectobacterium sp. NZEC135]MCW2479558.1 hypothetical protein [Candidatus Symbiopectobacterium sp. NZEC135]